MGGQGNGYGSALIAALRSASAPQGPQYQSQMQFIDPMAGQSATELSPFTPKTSGRAFNPQVFRPSGKPTLLGYEKAEIPESRGLFNLFTRVAAEGQPATPIFDMSGEGVYEATPEYITAWKAKNKR